MSSQYYVCVQRIETLSATVSTQHSFCTQEGLKEQWDSASKYKVSCWLFFKDSDILNILSGFSLDTLNFVVSFSVKQHSAAKLFLKASFLQVAASSVVSCAVSSPSEPVDYRLNRESHEHTVALSTKKFNITKIYTAFKILLCISDMVLNFLVSREAFNHTLNSWGFQNSDCFPCCNIIFLLTDDWDF